MRLVFFTSLFFKARTKLVKRRMLFFIVFFILGLDQASKFLIRFLMDEGMSLPIIANIFHITYVKNFGAAFGILNEQRIFFIIVTFLTVAAAIYFYYKMNKKNHLLRISLAFVIGGAIGNFIDRVVYGFVTDFFDFRVWPVFNVADAFIVIGVALLAWSLWRMEEKEFGDSND